MSEPEQRLDNFRLQLDPQGVFTATLDVPGRAVNVFDEHVMRELHGIVERIERDSTIKAVVFRSGKESGFLAGADVSRVESIKSISEAEELSAAGQAMFSRVEHLPMPTVAVIHGQCLGGGLEFALACRHRIASDDSRTRLGLPEIELGILPGWGGTQRLPRLVGLLQALRMILETKKVSAREAEQTGLVDLALAPERLETGVQQFVADLLAGKKPVTHRPGVLELLRDRTPMGQWLVLRTTRQKMRSHAAHYPALMRAVNAIQRGLRARDDAGYIAERKAFSELLFTPTCRNLIGLFFARERARKSETWTQSPVALTKDNAAKPRVAVIGAGVMGAGIAQLAAFQDYDVIVKEVTPELLDAGMGRIQKLIDDAVRKGAVSASDAAGKQQALHPTVDWDAIGTAGIAVEAVTEKEQVKLQVFRDLDQRLPKEAVLASNTSALSIQHLAEATQRPGQVAGLHFFNPVHRMQLVEVVRAPATNDPTVAVLVDLVRRLGKTPVVVKDSPGFLVNRILFPYLGEAVRMNCEGLATDQIDRQVRRFGMPLGPLELLDQVGLDVAADVARNLSGQTPDPGPAAERLAKMVQQGRLGKKSDKGFYFYAKGRRGKPVESIPEAEGGSRSAGKGGGSPGDLSLIQERLVCLLINEAARCLGEGIVAEPWIVDLAMVLGTGFAPFRGGPLTVADQWGLPILVQRLENLQHSLGERFAPYPGLREMAAAGKTFYPARK